LKRGVEDFYIAFIRIVLDNTLSFRVQIIPTRKNIRKMLN
jgi:hypothetical protein